jgi:glycine dehydrogenase subunit 1
VPDYLPHTDEEISGMLELLGLDSIEQLFDAIPKALQIAGSLELPEGMSEPDAFAAMRRYAKQNLASSEQLVCFAGSGAYDHEIPAVVRALGGRGEFVTAYTPYQPEVAQGVLQAIFEFQTMVSRLYGLPVSNASLYDGANALNEAVNLATASSRNQRVFLSSGIHPTWRSVVKTFAKGTGHEIVEVPLRAGLSDFDAVAHLGQPGVIVVGHPTFLGTLEDLGAVRRRADEAKALMVVAADPVASGVLKTAGSWGADVVVGEGQAFGTTLGFGGPYLGLFACTMDQVRRLPGRLVGETVDVEGRRSYVTTLRAREQDIRREKATSNVCTNQTLMAVVAAIQLGWLGTAGLRDVATRCVRATRYLTDQVTAIDGVAPLFAGLAMVRDVAITVPIEADRVLERLSEEGFLGGLSLASLTEEGDGSVDPALRDRTILMSATEKRSRAEIDRFAVALEKVVVA